MPNRVTIRIHHKDYRILAEEETAYIQRCADLVGRQLDEAMEGTTLSLVDGAVLAALNLADQYQKERQVSDNLRAQLKQALDENGRLARELAEHRREAKRAAKNGRKAKAEPSAAPEQEEP